MGYQQLVSGFDAREMWLDFRTIWSQYELDTFLLREDIIKPLSVDGVVWRSFFTQTTYSSNGVIVNTGSVFDLGIPAEYRAYNALWVNLEALLTFLDTLHVTQPYWVIAVADLVSEEDIEAERRAGKNRIKPIEIDPEWTFLGFDVADHGFTSGLTDSGFPPDEVNTLKTRWAEHLNEYHLFTDAEQAYDFADWCDRDPGHAPFHVYALYRLSP